MPRCKQQFLFPVPNTQLLTSSHPPPIPNPPSWLSSANPFFLSSFLALFSPPPPYCTSLPCPISYPLPTIHQQKHTVPTWWLEHKGAMLQPPQLGREGCQVFQSANVDEFSKVLFQQYYISLCPRWGYNRLPYIGLGSSPRFFRKIGCKFKTQIKRRVVSWGTPTPRKEQGKFLNWFFKNRELLIHPWNATRV